MKPLLISSGEPAGIGPDLCIALAGSERPLVVLCDKTILKARAKQLNQSVVIEDYQPGYMPTIKPNHLTVLSLTCPEAVIPGELNPKNSVYVLQMLKQAMNLCLAGEFAGLVTAPVHKGIINQVGYTFTGHTEFFANRAHSDSVMMLSCEAMKVALITTHVPLRHVPDAISEPLIIRVINQLHLSLKRDFGISQPKIHVAGLNPHAGEGGYLGSEEIDIIVPALTKLKKQGIAVFGPFPADTMFQRKQNAICDAYVAMYHDQGLAVLKYAGFGRAVNVTLGLPFVRTSVDHGTALELAATGRIDTGSIKAAVDMAAFISANRNRTIYDGC